MRKQFLEDLDAADVDNVIVPSFFRQHAPELGQ